MIGQKVKYKQSSYDTSIKEGTIMDKVIVGKYIEIKVSSGQGGVTNGTTEISITKYLILREDNKKIELIEPNLIIEIL